MKAPDTLLLQEIVSLLYYILMKMPDPVSPVSVPTTITNRWLDNQELMQSLHVSESTLQRWRQEGRLPFAKIKGKIWYLESEVDLMIKGAI